MDEGSIIIAMSRSLKLVYLFLMVGVSTSPVVSNSQTAYTASSEDSTTEVLNRNLRDELISTIDSSIKDLNAKVDLLSKNFAMRIDKITKSVDSKISSLEVKVRAEAGKLKAKI